MKYIKPIAAIVIFGVTLVAYQNCAQYELSSSLSEAEQRVIVDIPFTDDPNDPVTPIKVGDIADLIDSKQPSFPYKDAFNDEFVQRCSSERYNQEKAEVLNMVSGDATNTLIPVRFSISTGNVVDDTSFNAYRRSILKKDDDGVTEVYVGPKDQFIYRNTQANVFHYVADHTEARERYIKGERCFFDVIKVVGSKASEVQLNGAYNHGWAILNYGNKYVDDLADDFNLAPRLFNKIESLPAPQIIPLYVADIREQYFNFTTANYTLLNKEFTSSAVRRKEYTVRLKELFYLDRLFKHRDSFVNTLEHNWSMKGESYAGYDGIPQLFDNIIFGYNATVLSMQYTPIVIDLGKKHIMTSSLEWGSFFNLANLQLPADAKGYKRISHQVAWVGGELTQVTENGKKVWKRIADDGFLVLPDANNEVHTATQLFSNKTIVNGRTYNNGFEALGAMANKNCASDEIKEKYVGPWDTETYNKVKVWVDANRNGYADQGELSSLAETGIVALNPCFYNDDKVADRFGNRTRIRSAVLMASDLLNANTANMEEEILTRLFSGKKSNGEMADFRAMVDIYFRSKPSFYLENIETGAGADGGF